MNFKLPPKKNYDSLRGVRNPHDCKRCEIIRPGDIRHCTVKCVCHPRCNNGWVRTDRGYRQDRPDRSDPREECRVFPADQARLAAWAVMKAMVAKWMIRGHATTHHQYRKYLMRRLLYVTARAFLVTPAARFDDLQCVDGLDESRAGHSHRDTVDALVVTAAARQGHPVLRHRIREGA
jgi:hypothetical protein